MTAPGTGASLEPLDTDVDTPEDHGAEGWRDKLPTGWTLVALLLAMCFLAGAVGWTVGRGRTPSRSSADVAFNDDMIRHHESAIEMAQIEIENGAEEQIKVFAREIVKYQSYEIGLMDAWLDHWGYDRESVKPTAMAWMGEAVSADRMPGLPSAADLAELRQARGRDADALFVALMTAHHAAGAEMAETAAAKVDNAYVRDLATRMASTQRAEIDEMDAARARVSLPLVEVDRPVTLTPPGGRMSGMTGH